MELTVVTYGGGEILQNIFNGISMLFTKKSGSFFYFSYYGALLGALLVITRAFFSQSYDLLKEYFFPLIILFILCFNLKTTVIIEDRLAISAPSQSTAAAMPYSFISSTVDDVPFLIGYLAKTLSTIGYKITTAIENVMHTPNSQSYIKTGMIFGADSALDMSNIQIKDGNLDSNLREFCRNCIMGDLGIGRYTVDDLKNSNNLLAFLQSNTSKLRMVNYRGPITDPEALFNSPEERISSRQGTLLTCKEAIHEMAKKLAPEGAELEHQAKKEIFQRLPLAYQAMTKVSESQDKLIQQALVMSVIMDENSGAAFASKRAAMQQKSTYQAVGAMAGSSLIWMRVVLEALVFAAVIFVIPLAFLPGGIKYLLNWLFIAFWIQLWPPFYTILQYIMETAGSTYAKTYILGDTSGLSIYNTQGLSEIYSNVSALAGYLSLSIPYISYALLQGGVGSLVHLAGSLMGPTQSAGASAGAEAATGNYSFGNKSIDTLAFANTTGLQQNLAPTLAHGYMTERTARGTNTFGHDHSIHNENLSTFSNSLRLSESISSNVNTALNEAETAHQTDIQSYQTSLQAMSNQASDFSSYLSNDMNHSIGTSYSERNDISEAARINESIASSFAESHGCSKSQAYELLGGLSIGAFGVSGGGSLRSSWASDSTMQEARNLVETTDFSKNFQTVQDFASNYSSTESDGVGSRLAGSFSESLQNAEMNLSQVVASLDLVHSLSNTKSFIENTSFDQMHALDQPYFEYLKSELGSHHDAVHFMNHASPLEQAEKQSAFLQHMGYSIPNPTVNANIGEAFDHTTTSIPDITPPSMDLTTECYHNRIGNSIVNDVQSRINEGSKITSTSDRMISATRRNVLDQIENRDHLPNSSDFHPSSQEAGDEISSRYIVRNWLIDYDE